MKRIASIDLKIVNRMAKAGIIFAVYGPDGEVHLKQRWVASYVADPVAFWCAAYGCTREEYLEWNNSWHGGGKRIRCFAMTVAGSRCGNDVKGWYTSFDSWIDASRRGGCCSTHAVKAQVGTATESPTYHPRKPASPTDTA